jgi:hypothetical protein
MKPQHRIALLWGAFLALLLIAPVYGASMNKSISIESGGQSNGESTVNGSISIGEDATVTGSVKTVNGTIRIERNAKVEDAGTVNGSIRIASGVTADDLSSVNGSVKLGESVTVDGSISVVNGKIRLDAGTNVANEVSNVNGEISLTGAQVGGDLTTVNGDVTLDKGSTLRGRLIVQKPSGWGWNRDKRKPKIIIGPGSKVLGGIELEREVELFISESAEVGGVSGEMDMDDAVIFSGNRP